MRRRQKKNRRGNNEGCITQDSVTGRWRGSLIIGRDQRFRPVRRYVSGRTRLDVQRQLQDLIQAQRSGQLVSNDRQTLAEFLDRWLEDVARPKVRFSTFRNYKGLLGNKVKPHLGGYRLQEISPLHIQNLFSSLERKGESPYRRAQVHSLLYSALGRAAKWGMIATNPCASVDSPAIPTKDVVAINETQANVLLQTAASERLYALFVLAIESGLRLGELCGLRWQDISFKNWTLSVQRTAIEGQFLDAAGKLRVRPGTGEPKTNKGRRLINLTGPTISALWQHRKKMLSEGHLSWVFCDTHGGLLRRSNFNRRVWKPLIEKALKNLPTGHQWPPGFKFHHLRHTAASLRLAQGDHPKIVQELLGHSRISITLDRYSHLQPSMQEESAERLGHLMSRLIRKRRSG
jgi:integrase